MTFVILTAGIDLSVGSLLALAGLVGAYVAKGGLDDRFAIGAQRHRPATRSSSPFSRRSPSAWRAARFRGWRSPGCKVPPFVVTLGGLTAFRGAALLFSGGGPISGFSADYAWWGQGRIGDGAGPGDHLRPRGARCPSGASLHRLRQARLRHRRQCQGRRAERRADPADRDAGLCRSAGFFCGLAAFLLSARLNSAEAVAGLGLELTVIASVVIGGTSLFGGVGGIFGTVVGALLIGVLTNGLVLLNVSSFIQQILIGVILVAAVALDQFAATRRLAE